MIYQYEKMISSNQYWYIIYYQPTGRGKGGPWYDSCILPVFGSIPQIYSLANLDGVTMYFMLWSGTWFVLTRSLPQNLTGKSLGQMKNKKGSCKICFIREKNTKIYATKWQSPKILFRWCQMKTCQFHLKSLFNLIWLDQFHELG